MIGSAPDTVTPAGIDEACEALRERAARGATIAFVGGGTELGLGYEPERIDTVLHTTGLNRIVEYAPEDLTVTVEAGLTLGALQRELAREGQRLALDAPQADAATLGGLLATNNYGPRRTRFGTLRDLVVGMSFVRADGARVRGGGKVVKNVAGFDLPKLMVGSLGTLGLIASATFRLHPVPERSLWYGAPGADAQHVREICRQLVALQLEPAALVAIWRGETYTLYALFEGFAAGLERQGEAFDGVVRAVVGSSCENLAGDDVRGFEEFLESSRTRGNLRVRVSTPPAAFAQVEREVVRPLREAFATDVTAYPSVGSTFVCGTVDPGTSVLSPLERARAAAEMLGGNLVVTETTAELRERFDPFGTPPGALGIMRRLKDRFDPERRLNRGRQVGHL